jgi:hypothetical protein
LTAYIFSFLPNAKEGQQRIQDVNPGIVVTLFMSTFIIVRRLAISHVSKGKASADAEARRISEMLQRCTECWFSMQEVPDISRRATNIEK